MRSTVATDATDATDPMEGLVESLLHMHVNRVLAPDDDFGEFRLYDALSRVYRLDVGRRAAGQPPAVP